MLSEKQKIVLARGGKYFFPGFYAGVTALVGWLVINGYRSGNASLVIGGAIVMAYALRLLWKSVKRWNSINEPL